MQILHYCARLRLIDGGVVRAILDLTAGLVWRGKEVTLLVTEGEDYPTQESGIQIMRTGDFDRPHIRFSASKLASLKQHIADADVLHLHTPWHTFLSPTFFPLLLCQSYWLTYPPFLLHTSS